MGYLTWILGLLGAIMLELVKDEISARMPGFARWCVHQAADRMPDCERWREEWLAHLNECPGKLGQLLHAFGVLGIGQAQSLRFWIEIVRYFPGIRWHFISGLMAIIAIIPLGISFYAWCVSIELPSGFAESFTLLTLGCSYSGWKGNKLFPRDAELIAWVKAYREAHRLN